LEEEGRKDKYEIRNKERKGRKGARQEESLIFLVSLGHGDFNGA
jgi:hypothetical protein